jgi:hypothetical protein
MTEDAIKKFKQTIITEINFSEGYHFTGIWVFLSGFGANRSTRIKEIAVTNQRMVSVS